MEMITLVENSALDERFAAEHGLSIFVKTEKHRLLMDTGQTAALLDNAAASGVDLTAVDTVVLSHGHYDHTGGVLPFCTRNRTAQILLQRTAAEPHFNGEKYIGVDPAVFALPNVRLLDGDTELDDELFLFAGVRGRRCFPPGNKKLTRMENGKKTPDDFAHEQCLVITQGKERWLLSGCAHNGILNILDRYRSLFGGAPDYVVSGFHMMKRDGAYSVEETELILQTAKALAQTKTRLFTGHCTGDATFALMKNVMGEQLVALHAGCRIL